MLAGSHRNAWPDETGTGGRTNRNTQPLNQPSYVTDNGLLFIHSGYRVSEPFFFAKRGRIEALFNAIKQ